MNNFISTVMSPSLCVGLTEFKITTFAGGCNENVAVMLADSGAGLNTEVMK